VESVIATVVAKGAYGSYVDYYEKERRINISTMKRHCRRLSLSKYHAITSIY